MKRADIIATLASTFGCSLDGVERYLAKYFDGSLERYLERHGMPDVALELRQHEKPFIQDTVDNP